MMGMYLRRWSGFISDFIVISSGRRMLVHIFLRIFSRVIEPGQGIAAFAFDSPHYARY